MFTQQIVRERLGARRRDGVEGIHRQRKEDEQETGKKTERP